MNKRSKIPSQVKTGGGMGSTEMDDLDKANAEGAGVTLNIKSVGSDPNEGNHLAPEQSGAE